MTRAAAETVAVLKDVRSTVDVTVSVWDDGRALAPADAGRATHDVRVRSRPSGVTVPPAARRIASIERSTSSVVVAWLDTEMRIARMPCQVVPLSQQVPSR